MAFKEVEIEEFQPKNYFNFNAIGDRLAGWFIKSAEVDGKFGPKTEITIRDKEGIDHTVSANFDLKRRFDAVEIKPGNKVIVTYAKDIDTGKGSPMKQFKLLVDDEVTPLPAAKKAPASENPFE